MSAAGIGPGMDFDATAANKAEELLERLKKEVQAEFKDIGVLRKELTVTVPAGFIADRLQHDFDEVRDDAVLPGFRKGKAPIALVRKRFGSDVQKSLKTQIVGQSFMAALQNNEIEVLGDPLFKLDSDGGGVKLVELSEALPKLNVTPEKDFSYTCELEVKPTFELPALEGIDVKRPKFEITDAMIDEQIQRQLKIRGRYEPVEAPAEDSEDQLIADVALRVDGEVINQEANVELGVRPARLDGIQLRDLGEQLRGKKAGDTVTVDCAIPDDYARADVRGKNAQFEFKVHEVKRLRPMELAAFVEQVGCENEAELRGHVRDQLEAERDELVNRALREQVTQYLLDNTALEVPPGLSARQADRAVMRRVIELQQHGVPPSEVEAKIDELRTSAGEEVARSLKVEFIMEKVAEKLEVTITDEDMNGQIAAIAARYGRRFDRVRDDLAHRGLLPQLAEAVRQRKCLEILLGQAKIVDAQPDKG